MAEKEFEQDDPMAFVQMYLDTPADDAFYQDMAETFIEEYMMMGWSDEEIFHLFEDPFYRGTHEIWQRKGETFVKNLIREVRHG